MVDTMVESKRQVFPKGLWVVGTPIGNLQDLSFRARQALEQADSILCEDTRRISQLLSFYGIPTHRRLIRCDAYAERLNTPIWVAELLRGKCFGLVSDAGTPALSDPGARLVRACQQAGIQVVPIPGVSAVTALLSVSGFETTCFVFRGFFPRTNSQQKKEIQKVCDSPFEGFYIWFESPFRIAAALSCLSKMLPEVLVVVGKELTKVYEKVFFGQAQQVVLQVNQEIEREGKRGEWCFGVHKEEALSAV